MKKFYPSDVAGKPHPKELMDAILGVILAWPNLESALTIWISHALDVRPSETGILLGAMDIRTKIDKLKALYKHRKDAEAVTLLEAINKEHKEHVKPRNFVVHALLLGASKATPKEAYFLTSQAIPDQHGFMKIIRMPYADLNAAAAFAGDRARDIRALLKTRGAKLE